MRIATGASPFCRVCELATREASAPAVPARKPGGFAAAASDIFDDLLNGRRVSKNKVASAINEFAWAVGGNYTDYHPDIGPPPPEPGSRFDPPDDFRPPPGWHREQAPPQPPPANDPAKVAAARRSLGYGPSERITAESLKARHRELAKRHHPDRGGSLGRMQEINAAIDTLTAAL